MTRGHETLVVAFFLKVIEEMVDYFFFKALTCGKPSGKKEFYFILTEIMLLE